MITIDLNTGLIFNLFSGTYENQWDVSETEDNGDELEVEYNFKDLMKSIVHVYQDHADEIVEALDIPWITSIKFDGFFNPREYNFMTDQLEFKAEIDENAMIHALEGLKNNKEFSDFLIEHYRSRDGFWSYTPDNYSELYEQITTEGREYIQAVSALINFLSGIKDDEYMQGIEGTIWESWQGNGYGGLDYQIVTNHASL